MTDYLLRETNQGVNIVSDFFSRGGDIKREESKCPSRVWIRNLEKKITRFCIKRDRPDDWCICIETILKSSGEPRPCCHWITSVFKPYVVLAGDIEPVAKFHSNVFVVKTLINDRPRVWDNDTVNRNSIHCFDWVWETFCVRMRIFGREFITVLTINSQLDDRVTVSM